MFPTGAKTLRIELPCSDVRFAGLRESLSRDLTVGRESHGEFSAARGSSGKWLTVEKSRLDVAGAHRLSGVGGTRLEKHCCN